MIKLLPPASTGVIIAPAGVEIIFDAQYGYSYWMFDNRKTASLVTNHFQRSRCACCAYCEHRICNPNNREQNCAGLGCGDLVTDPYT